MDETEKYELSEVPESQLVDELQIRILRRTQKVCDYCGKDPESVVCKFPLRHHWQKMSIKFITDIKGVLTGCILIGIVFISGCGDYSRCNQQSNTCGNYSSDTPQALINYDCNSGNCIFNTPTNRFKIMP